MTIPSRANVAQVVAKLLARRSTRQDEIPELMRSVQSALASLEEPEEFERAEGTPGEVEVTVAPVEPRRRQRRAAPTEEAAPAEPAANAPAAPRLIRRAEVVPPAAATSEPQALAAPAAVVLRGIVKWFDLRTRRGALRLPGLSGDVAVEPALLDAMAISRLYKGQEIEATMSAADATRVERLSIPGGAWQVSAAGGVVRNRHAKPVVVELKREALRRVAARAEAELVLGPGRSR